MADPVVHLTAGIPDSGTGNITTLGQTLIDGANASIGATTDAAVTAGAAGTLLAKLRSISRDLVANIVLAAGTNIIGKVGIDQTTPGTTNGVQVNAALPAGTNVIGKTSIDQTTPGTTNGVQVTNAASKWKAGASAGFASAFGTEVNSVVSGNSILSSINVTNGTGLDQNIDISVSLGSFTSGAGSPYVGFYLYPLNQDGSTYGDGRFASSTTAQPLSNYFLGAIGLIPSVTQVQTGAVTGMILPPGDFKLVMYNLAGGTLAASANTLKYRTYNAALQ